MEYLTDVPEQTEALPIDVDRMQRVSVTTDATLEAAELWTRFSANTAPWYATTKEHAFGLAGPLMVMGRAPTSQFDRMTELLAAGQKLPDGLMCVAMAGSRFRGQRGRSWSALPGNLHLSAHLDLDLDAAEMQVALSLLPVVAASAAIEEVSEGRVQPSTKWVNDLTIGGRKVGGVLSTTQLHGKRVRNLVIGVGINVERAPVLPSTARRLAATALSEADPLFCVDGAWARLLPALTRHLDAGRTEIEAGNGASLFDRYRERAAFLGRHVTIWPVDDEGGGRVRAPTPIAQGRVLELRPDLSLILEGVAEPIRTGRMTIDR